MPSLTLKNVPEPLHRQLREAAAHNHRSLNGEVIARLEAQFAREQSVHTQREQLDRLRARLPAIDHHAIDRLKRQGRP